MYLPNMLSSLNKVIIIIICIIIIIIIIIIVIIIIIGSQKCHRIVNFEALFLYDLFN